MALGAIEAAAVTPTALQGWGYGEYGQLNFPSGLTAVTAISAGSTHVLALNADGTVTAWGDNSVGQSTVPAGLREVVAIAAGGAHSLALKSDGTVVAWGSSAAGLTTIPSAVHGVTAIAAGTSHCVALKSDGTVVAWGDSHFNQTNAPAGLAGVTTIAAGYYHTVALKTDGSVVAWGNDRNGQCTVPPTLTGTTAIAAGGNLSLAVTATGELVTWGQWLGSIDLPPPPSLATLSAIDIGASHVLALRANGTVLAWGVNGNGQCAVPAPLPGVLGIAASANYSIVLRDATGDVPPSIQAQSSGTTTIEGGALELSVTATGGSWPLAYQWYRDGSAISGATQPSHRISRTVPTDSGSYTVNVRNQFGTVLSTPMVVTVTPLPVTYDESPARQVVAPGQTLVLSVATTGTGTISYQWHHQGREIAGATSRTFTKTAALSDAGWYWVNVRDDVALRRSQVFHVLTAPGRTQVKGFGSSSYGQLNIPAGLTTLVAVAPGSSDVAALQADGTAVTWQGTGYARVLSGLPDVVALANAASGLLALKSDGTVVTSAADPWSSVWSGLTDVVALAAGPNHRLALRADGSVVAGHFEGFPQLGNIPAGLANVVAIAAGDHHSVALKADGTVVVWGANNAHQLDVPAGLANVTAIAAGSAHSLALRADGSVVGWGFNGNHQAEPPAELHDVISIAAGDYRSYAVQRDGTVVAWGARLQDDIPPSSDPRIYRVCANGGVAFTLRDASTDAAPQFGLHPADATVRLGGTVTLQANASGGTAEVTYQWRKDGREIAGAVFNTLTLAPVSLADGGVYDVVARNYLGSATSAAACLSVDPTSAAFSHLANISARAHCSTGNSVTIGGFVVTGNGRKRVLIRAVGPTLTTQGIGANEVLVDPTVEVHHGNAIVAQNDDWGSNANAADITSTAVAIGAMALAATDTHSSALLTTLEPGVYSFIVKGKSDSSGIVLLEVYDADTVTTGSKFVDISARGYATTGNGVAIGGFVISGNAPKRVLMRAVGPTLTTWGIGQNEVLLDPLIELHHGSATLATNDDWGTNTNQADIVTTGARIGATPFATGDTRSSALLMTLQPGIYSFIAKGKNDTSGIVLVEVYDAD